MVCGNGHPRGSGGGGSQQQQHWGSETRGLPGMARPSMSCGGGQSRVRGLLAQKVVIGIAVFATNPAWPAAEEFGRQEASRLAVMCRERLDTQSSSSLALSRH